MKGSLIDMRNNFKKGISLLLAIVIVLSLTACGDTTNVIKAGDITIDTDEFAYNYCLIWENYQQNTIEYDVSNGEGSGFKKTGYDYTVLPFEQEYLDKSSMYTGVTIEELGVENPTWEDVFVYLTFNSILRLEYGISEAKAKGITLELSETEEIDNDVNKIKAEAEKVNLSFEDYLKQRYGASLTEEEYRAIYEESLLFNLADEKLKEYYMTIVTEEEKQSEYELDKEAYDSYGETLLSDVRHILIAFPIDSETNKVVELSESEKSSYYKKAQTVFDLYSKNPTEDNFVKLVEEYSDDTASVSEGGLYTNVKMDGTFIAPFQNWATDPARQVGDVSIVETSYGYHIMYFAKSYGSTKDYYITRNAAVDKYDKAFRLALEEEFALIDLRSEPIKNITAEQNELFRVLMGTQYRLVIEDE